MDLPQHYLSLVFFTCTFVHLHHTYGSLQYGMYQHESTPVSVAAAVVQIRRCRKRSRRMDRQRQIEASGDSGRLLRALEGRRLC